LIAYADTGFLVSLYGQDTHSPLAKALARSNPVFILTSFGETEFTNAVELRVFRKEWTRREARAVSRVFSENQAAGVFRIAAITPDVWESAVILSRRHTARYGIRTLDLIHVAAALVLKPDVFYTFDDRQRNVAKVEQIKILPA
jgi:predicted nucleic acid-binding protein